MFSGKKQKKWNNKVFEKIKTKPSYEFHISKSKIVLFLVVMLFFNTINVFAQSDTIKPNGKYFKSYWTDTKEIIKAPAHWKGKQWITFAGLSGGLVLTYVYDKEIYDFAQKQRTTQTENISKYFIEPWGSGLYSLPLLGTIYFTGKKNSRHRQVALTGIKAFIISGAFVQAAKHIFHRHRPGDNDPPNPSLWEGPFPLQTSYTSFPSGHTTTAFAVASVLACGYKDKKWIGITSYTMATLVGLSRIHDGEHWASDIFGGAVLGTFIGVTLSKVNFKNIDLFPTAYQGTYGMGMVFHLN